MSERDPVGYLGQVGGWVPVVALADRLEAGDPEAITSLLRESHRAGLVMSFDWPTWMTGRGRELSGHPDEIAEATLEECRRLLVAHLRRDRFVKGHLSAMIERGEIVAVLRRVEAIIELRRASKQASGAASTNGQVVASRPAAAKVTPPGTRR